MYFLSNEDLIIYSKYDCFVTENNRKCSKVSVLFRATRYAFNTQEGNYYVLEKVYSPSDNCFMLAYNMLKTISIVDLKSFARLFCCAVHVASSFSKQQIKKRYFCWTLTYKKDTFLCGYFIILLRVCRLFLSSYLKIFKR